MVSVQHSNSNGFSLDRLAAAVAVVKAAGRISSSKCSDSSRVPKGLEVVEPVDRKAAESSSHSNSRWERSRRASRAVAGCAASGGTRQQIADPEDVLV